MNKATLSTAVNAAYNFIETAKLVKFDGVYLPSSKANSAVKRASMDLTRALADMRRPG
jgi:hypothetical protein